jgi:hypothetical protein
MIKLFAIILCVGLTACGPRDIAMYPTIPVIYEPIASSTWVVPIASTAISQIVKEVRLDAATVILYTKKDDELFYMGIRGGGPVYEKLIYGDGDAVGYGDVDNIHISQIDLDGNMLLKIEGFLGANAPITHYIRVDEGVPRSILKMERYIQEFDVNNDGIKELIVSIGGTIPVTEIMITKHSLFIKANLNELMNAVVTYDNEQNQFLVYEDNNQPPDLYQLTSEGMEYVGTQKPPS